MSREDIVNVKDKFIMPYGYSWNCPRNTYEEYRENGWTNEQLISFEKMLKIETKKEFKVSYWYKCIDASSSVLQNGEYYQVSETKEYDTVEKSLVLKGYGREYSLERFDINSESSFNPITKVNVGWVTPPKVSIDINVSKQTLNKQEETNMNNANRCVVNVKLLDNDSGLPVECALVAQFQGIVTEDSDAVVINEILLNKNVANMIAEHNKKRMEQTDLEILKRTGNDVKLRQVKLKDLTWVVTTA